MEASSADALVTLAVGFAAIVVGVLGLGGAKKSTEVVKIAISASVCVTLFLFAGLLATSSSEDYRSAWELLRIGALFTVALMILLCIHLRAQAREDDRVQAGMHALLRDQSSDD